MERRLMLDSGAFGVWSKGHRIKLADYANFCVAHPGTSYFVSLDVIPGRPNDKTSLQPATVWDCCEQGWKNYQDLLRKLPMEKVIPVFHQGESITWLERYLKLGSPYLGLSFTSLRGTSTAQKVAWLKQVRPYVTDAAGAAVTKLHGFAVTSWPLMQVLPWHSVDSATWKIVAARGGVFVPRLCKDGSWDYSRTPHVVRLSPAISGGTRSRLRVPGGATFLPVRYVQYHGGKFLERALRYVEELGVPLGDYDVQHVAPDYKLSRPEEIWLDRKRRLVQQTRERGAITSFEYRGLVNIRYMREVTVRKLLPVKHIYYAGDIRPDIEENLGNRLMSYVDVRRGENHAGYGVFQGHLQRLADRQPW